MSKDEKCMLLANQFQYWLNFNEKYFDGSVLNDDVKVVPPELPSRGVLKEWIKILKGK